MRRAALLVLLCATPAEAFESQCRSNGTDFATSVCASPASNPECAAGLDAARGRLFGEHTVITRDALVAAGLSTFLETKAVPPYYADSGMVAATFPQVAPALPGRARIVVQRPQTLAELSQLPDVAYSLPDYLLGNEHCFAWTLGPNPSYTEINECHRFETHMGALNSTHFLPQARSMYRLYHGLAMARARRCKALQVGFPPSHPLAAIMTASLPLCEREALAYEAVGSHYLQDAWSSGHMWQRWGWPVESYRDDQIFVGAITGLIHGFRSSVRTYTDEWWIALPAILPPIESFQHDQLNMPGPWDPLEVGVASAYPEDVDVVEFQMTRTATPVTGGGDLYYTPCTAERVAPVAPFTILLSPIWSISEHPELSVQKSLMLGCTAAGFAQVYDLGPRTRGARTGAGPGAVLNPEDDFCWAQRVNNRSMWLGFGISGIRLSRDPAMLARIGAIAAIGGADLTWSAAWEGIDRMRVDLVRMAPILQLRASRFPEGTASADLKEGATGELTLLGQHPNGWPVAVNLIEQDRVPYLERHNVRQWTPTADRTPCQLDSDCGPRRYCAPTGGILAAGCVDAEASILHAYRSAEVDTFCRFDGRDQLDDAIEACRTSPTSAACAACQQMVLPRVRNADKAGQTAPDSICDTLATAGLLTQPIRDDSVVYIKYQTDDGNGVARAKSAASCICRGAGFPDPSVKNEACAIQVTPSDSVAPVTVPRESGTASIQFSANNPRVLPPMGQTTPYQPLWAVTSGNATMSASGIFTSSDLGPFRIVAIDPLDSTNRREVAGEVTAFGAWVVGGRDGNDRTAVSSRFLTHSCPEGPCAPPVTTEFALPAGEAILQADYRGQSGAESTSVGRISARAVGRLVEVQLTLSGIPPLRLGGGWEEHYVRTARLTFEVPSTFNLMSPASNAWAATVANVQISSGTVTRPGRKQVVVTYSDQDSQLTGSGVIFRGQYQ